MSPDPKILEEITSFYSSHLEPAVFDPISTAVAGLLNLGEKNLELACGTGSLTRLILARLESAQSLTASDVSPQMVDEARKRLDCPVEIADMLSLPFSCSFDSCTSQFGIMFVRDKARAFSEMARVTVGGGWLNIVVWEHQDRNPWSKTVVETVNSFLEVTQPLERPFLPYSCSDTNELRSQLESVGWQEVQISPIEVRMRGTPEVFAKGTVDGSFLKLALIERNFTRFEELRAAVSAAVDPRQSRLRAILIQARKA